MISNLGGDVWEAAEMPLKRHEGQEVGIPPEVVDCVWKWFDLSEARTVPCTSLAAFYMYLSAPGTESVRASCLSSTGRFVDLQAFGPIADDANTTQETEGRLRAEYRLNKPDIHDPIIGFSEEEKRVIVEVIRKKGRNINMKLFHAATGLARVA